MHIRTVPLENAILILFNKKKFSNHPGPGITTVEKSIQLQEFRGYKKRDKGM